MSPGAAAGGDQRRGDRRVMCNSPVPYLMELSGIMSEAELHVFRGRMRQGLLNNVRRGEVFMEPSTGYIRSPEGGFDFDPEEQARAVVRLVFDQFERLGTVRKALRYLFTNDIRLGIRPHAGPTRGQLEWRLPTRGTVTEMLRCRDFLSEGGQARTVSAVDAGDFLG